MTDHTEHDCLHCTILEAICTRAEKGPIETDELLHALAHVVSDIIVSRGEKGREEAMTRFSISMMGALLNAAVADEDGDEDGETAVVGEDLDEETANQLRDLFNAKAGAVN